jgi:hypothetical protein
VCLVALIFSISRLIYWVLGVRFDASTRDRFWQFLDSNALAEAPAASLAYLHTQPPLFNAFLWFSESVSPFGLYTTTRLVFFILGLGMAATAYLLSIEIGLSRVTSVILGIVVAVSPAGVLYENWLYTTYPTAFGTLALTYSVACFFRRRQARWLLAAAVMVTGLVLLRSAFHPLIILPMLLPLAMQARRSIPVVQILAIMAVPIFVVGGLVTKNQLLFDSPTTSSWGGMSLAKMTVSRLPPDLQQELVDEGLLHSVSLVGPFQPFEFYPRDDLSPIPRAGIAVFDEQFTSEGQPNLNYAGFLQIEDLLLEDALAVIRRDPAVYAAAVAEAARTYVGPPTCYSFIATNRSEVSVPDRVWRVVVYGELPFRDKECPALVSPTRYSGPGILVIGSWVLMVVVAAVALVGRGALAKLVRAEPGALYGVVLVLYLAAVTSLLEIGENQRFRMEVEPLQIVLTVWSVVAAKVCWDRWRRDADDSVCETPPS